jgi:DNA-directed RNA polymerase I and III subunit RPAC2
MSTAQHPRDSFVLHQEHLARLNEGDDIDTSTLLKVRVDLQSLSDRSSTAMVTFSHEDHTVGNPLRHVLMQNPLVSSAGYAIPHPLEPKMVLHVQAHDYAVDVVASGLHRLADICDVTVKSFEASLRKQPRRAK